jgi:hypothetical protein
MRTEMKLNYNYFAWKDKIEKKSNFDTENIKDL